jgi:Domain of unknown function (DUF4336)
MRSPAGMTYPPLDTLKDIAEDVWVVDGPVIWFGMPWPRMPFPTRMTIIRLDGHELFVHSPTPLSPALKGAVSAIGTVRFIIGPNRLHYSWIPEWRAEFPDAEIYLAPGVGERINFAAAALSAEHGYPWDGELATLPISSSFMTEVEFFHFKTRTLVLTDLIENFEKHKINTRLMRWAARVGGVMDPDGSMPRDMRFTFRKRKTELRTAVEAMISWNPERIILAHGRWYKHDGVTELRRAFRWVLGADDTTTIGTTL